jgi:hypothetical protein
VGVALAVAALQPGEGFVQRSDPAKKGWQSPRGSTPQCGSPPQARRAYLHEATLWAIRNLGTATLPGDLKPSESQGKQALDRLAGNQ